MLSFATAKKLADACFPQAPAIDISGIDGPFFGGFYYITPPKSMDGGEVAPNFMDQRQYERFINDGAVCSYGEIIKIPQLDELIRECGEEFYSVVFPVPDFQTDGRWRSFSKADEWNTVATGRGRSADEAVAEMWFKIKK